MNFHEQITLPLADSLLKHGAEVDVGEVHAQNIKGLSALVTIELQNVVRTYPMPDTMSLAQLDMRPNLPWAEDHFKERVSGHPLNPAPSHEWWPHAEKGNTRHVDEWGQFSHTYPERFWPRYACADEPYVNKGIRYPYGDLEDLVRLLARNPLTRQAYLPVWFPEDLGAAEQGERVPCTLGYHFLIRDRRVHINYYLRSCDFWRFFIDDMYMAVRLAQWVRHRLSVLGHRHFRMGDLTFVISSLHAFQGDLTKLQDMIKEGP